jgi:transposase InsO family protein
VNAICERFLGSVRRECLDHLLILSERHLKRVLAEYVRYFNHTRPHQGLRQRVPEDALLPAPACATTGTVVVLPVLGGLHHEYRRAG